MDADKAIDIAVAHLLRKENSQAHYLGFSAGGTIAWKAGLKGLPMKSLYVVSAAGVGFEKALPSARVKAIFGGNDKARPDAQWCRQLGISPQVIEDFGHGMYTDEKIIKKISLDLLRMVTKIPSETGTTA